MTRQRPLRTLLALALIMLAPLLSRAQAPDLKDRPVSEVRIEGLKQVPRQLVLNQVRQTKGSPYDPQVVEQDIVRLTHLGRFGSVRARVEPQPDNSVVLIYVVTEQPLLSDVQVAGNKDIPDRELLNLILLRSGDPVDPFLIDRAKNLIKEAYQKKGHYQTDVTVDAQLLKDSNILLFRVREGPVLRIQDIKIEGNTVFTSDQLLSKVKSETYLFIFQKGLLNPEQLDRDVAAVRGHYRDNGYLDAQVGRTISVSPDGQDAVVSFVISEGRQYTVDKITIEGNIIYSDAQILAAMPIKVGDVFSADRVRKSEAAVLELYGKIGYIETKVARPDQPRGIVRLFHPQEAKVDLVVPIEEGRMSFVGKVVITGNEATQGKVIYRKVHGLEPGRPFDRDGIETTQQRLRESEFFSDAKITVLGNADDPYRDVLIEVTEKRTGSVTFGAGISSDGGVIGQIGLSQKNFDITDFPETWGELFTGKAFRGAGQFFSINIQPGTQFSTYSVSFREPSMFESDYGLNTSAGFFSSIYDQYSEQRLGGSVGVDKRFGDVWSGQVSVRAQDVSINGIALDAPDDVFAVQGSHALTSLALTVRRNTTDSGFFPTHGSDVQLTFSQAGALGGDYTFTAASGSLRKYWTLYEDYLGTKTILTMRSEMDYIFQKPDRVPVFERFYAGGERTFRGFRFRGVGPRGIRHDTGLIGGDPVGGTFMFLWGLEYNAPIYEDYLRWVVFTDTGTVESKFGFGQYRVAVGAGIRLKIPMVSPVPFAFDFAIPLLSQTGDERRFFSFDVAVPF